MLRHPVTAALAHGSSAQRKARPQDEKLQSSTEATAAESAPTTAATTTATTAAGWTHLCARAAARGVCNELGLLQVAMHAGVKALIDRNIARRLRASHITREITDVVRAVRGPAGDARWWPRPAGAWTGGVAASGGSQGWQGRCRRCGSCVSVRRTHPTALR